MLGKSRIFALFLLFSAAGVSATTMARADAATPRRLVEVSVMGSDEDAQALEGSLRELLARLEIQLEIRRVDHLSNGAVTSNPGTEPIAGVGIDLTSDPVRISFRDAKTGRALGERNVPKTSSPSLTLEAVAHIVQSGVEDLTAEAPPPAKPEAPNPPPPLPAPIAIVAPLPEDHTSKDRTTSQPSNHRWGLDVGAFCDGSYVASNVGLVVGGGGAVSFALKRGNFRPALLVSGSYHAAFDGSDSYVSDRAELLSLRAIPNLQLLGGERWSIDGGIGGGVDTFFTSPRSATVPGTFIQGSRTDVDPIALAMVDVHFAVASSADLFLAFSLPVDLAPHRYLDEVGDTTNTVFLPARVRPSLAFGFEFTAFGRAPWTAATGATR